MVVSLADAARLAGGIGPSISEFPFIVTDRAEVVYIIPMSYLHSSKQKQIAGGFLSVKWVHHPDLCRPYLERAAKAGYRCWFCVVRHMKLNLTDEAVRTAIARVVDIAHELGLKFLLDTDPTHFAEDVVSRDPSAALWVITPVTADVYNGRFEVFVPAARGARQGDVVEVTGAFALGGKKGFTDLKAKLEVEWEHILRPLPGYRMVGRLPEDFRGRVKLYVTVSDNSKIDHCSRAYYAFQAELLELFRGVPLDGITWDEPGKGHGDMTRFRAGAEFFRLFRKTNGYDLREKVIYLDEFDDTPEAAKVRCDYYRTLQDMHVDVQRVNFTQAKEIFGDQIVLGTHPTWSGLPCDLAAGVFDHFRMSHILTEAWSDGGFNYERKMHLMPFVLADSIKKGFGRRNSYFNDWATQSNHSYYRLMNRLKTLYHINTFSHVYSDFTEELAGMNLEPFRTFADNDVSLMDRVDAMIGERTSEAPFAIWYGWEGYAAMNKAFARAVYTFFENSSLMFNDASVWADYVSSELLAEGKMENGKLRTAGGLYTALVMPYARVLPAGLWAKLLAFNKKGLKLVFVGPEPAFAADGAGIDFAAAAGFRSFGPASYLQAAAARRFTVAPGAWEPAFLDVTPEVEIFNKKSERIVNHFGELLALHSGGGLYWMPGMDPREDLTGLLRPWNTSPLQTIGNCSARLFGTASDAVVVLAPREGVPGWGLAPACMEDLGTLQPEAKIQPFTAILRLAGKTFEVSGCEWAVLKIKDGKVRGVISEGKDFAVK